MKTDFTIMGMKELQRQLVQRQLEMNRAIKKSALEQATTLKDEISGRAPRGATRRLAKAVKVKSGYQPLPDRVYYRAGEPDPLAVVVGLDSRVAFYAHMVEYGTSHSAAKPFVRPAVDSLEGRLHNNLANDIKAGVEKGL